MGSNEYAWFNANIVQNGATVGKVIGFKFSVKKEKEYIYGRGEDPIGIQSGNKSYEGELTFFQSVAESMQGDLPEGKDLTDADPFDLVVAYVGKQGQSIRTYTLKHIEITEDTREAQQGNKNMPVTFPIMFLGREASSI